MVDFANRPTLRGVDGKVITSQVCVIFDDHSRLIADGAYYGSGATAAFSHWVWSDRIGLADCVFMHNLCRKRHFTSAI